MNRTREDEKLLPGQQEVPGDENDAELRRRGNRRGAGQDTPAGSDTDRSVEPAKREQTRRDGVQVDEGKGVSEGKV